ncbi:MAG: phosphate regulon transcriptional regulator PhoB [Alphaproteobacteria bacterium]
MKPTILIVEDEDAIVALLRYNLEREGFGVTAARDGEEALQVIADSRPTLAIIDWMIPYVSGLELCRQIRRRPDTRNLPIIILTARGEEADRIRGLESGADDYVTKPFSPSELIARVRAVLRRASPSFGQETLKFGDIVMDLVAHRVQRGKENVHLGPTEFRLLRHFLENPGRVFSREQLLDAVWGRDVFVGPRTVDTHIRRLRQALAAGGCSDIIRTVRSAGYGLDTAA